MKHLPLFLFTIGVLLEISAFFIGYADHVPMVFRFISPSYFRAKEGLNKLTDQKSLEPSDKGFPEISELFKKVLLKQNPSEVIEKINPTKFVHKGAMLSFSTERAKEVIKVEVNLSNGQSVPWDINEITFLVNQLKSRNIFKWALLVFFTGVIIQGIGYKVGKN